MSNLSECLRSFNFLVEFLRKRGSEQSPFLKSPLESDLFWLTLTGLPESIWQLNSRPLEYQQLGWDKISFSVSFFLFCLWVGDLFAHLIKYLSQIMITAGWLHYCQGSGQHIKLMKIYPFTFSFPSHTTLRKLPNPLPGPLRSYTLYFIISTFTTQRQKMIYLYRQKASWS